MSKAYYKKAKSINKKIIFRVVGLLIALTGLSITLYVFEPVISWEIYLAPAFASNGVIIPIPKNNFLTPASIQNLLSSQTQTMGVDFNNAKNWFIGLTYKEINARIAAYNISIPRLGITNAVTTTQDYDLGKHLVSLPGTAIPPDKGNTVIFGHSTLPQLYNPRDYHTIFANVHKMQVGDEILVNVSNITYTYKVYSITIVDPSDTSPLTQTMDDSYLTIITCTPPGTVWKRLIISARIENL